MANDGVPSVFVPPSSGAPFEGHDWILVLDDADRNYAPPGPLQSTLAVEQQSVIRTELAAMEVEDKNLWEAEKVQTLVFGGGAEELVVSNSDGQYALDIANGASEKFGAVVMPIHGDFVLMAQVESVAAARAGIGLVGRVENKSELVAATFLDGEKATFISGELERGVLDRINVPYWVRLTRDGDEIENEISVDSFGWTSLGSVTLGAAELWFVLLVGAGDENGRGKALLSEVHLGRP